MLRPIRTLFLMVMVFFAGLMTERYQHGERCNLAGGTVRDGLCNGAQQ